MVIIAGPIFSGGSGEKHFLNYHEPQDAYPAYKNDLQEMEEYVHSLREQGALYAREAEEFVLHLKNLIRNKSLHDDLHTALWPIVKSVRKLVEMRPYDEKGQLNAEFQSGVKTLESQITKLNKHRNVRLLVGSIFALLTAMTIAAAIAISIMIPGAAIFAPVVLGIAAVKPAIFAGITYSDAYKAHGLLKRVNPMLGAMKQTVSMESTPKCSN